MTRCEGGDAATRRARLVRPGIRRPWRPGIRWLLPGLVLFASSALAQIPGLPRPAPEPAAEPAAQSAGPAPDGGRASYGALADILENDAERAKLIGQLREMAAGRSSAPAAQPAASSAQAAHGAGASMRIAAEAQRFLEGAADGAATVVATLRQVFSGRAGEAIRLPDWKDSLQRLALVALATIVAFLVLRAVAARLYARMDAWMVRRETAAGYQAQPPRPGQCEQARQPRGDGQSAPPLPPHAGEPRAVPAPAAGEPRLGVLYGRALVITGSLLVDLAAILLAAAAGYGAARLQAAAPGALGRFDLLFVNAFVVVEASKALVRMVFARRYRHLRLFPMDDDLAHYWNDRLERLAAIGGYGMMLGAPMLAELFSPELGRAFGLVVTLAVYWYAVRMVWKNRARVGERIRRQAAASSSAFLAAVLRMLAHTWHLAAIAYCTAMLVVSQVDAAGALPYMVYGTLQSALSIGVGLLLSAALGTLLARRLSLPEEIRTRLPMLEARLNAYIPAFLRGVRLVIAVVVALFVLDAWRVFRLADWVVSDSGTAAVAAIVRVAVVLLAGAAAWTVVASIIEHRLSAAGREPSPRERTLLSLFRNATLVVIATMTVLIVLSQVGIDIGPLIAGAGVVGLAIGFGAQKLVQDVINGVFIQLENGMNQNDVVEVGGVFGTVEKITIRSVGIRTLDGGYHMIPFSSVDKVANHMRDFSYHLGEYTVAYRESVDDVVHHLERAFEELMTDPVLSPEVLEDMTIAGVTSLNERGFTVRVLIKTRPGMQWAVQRGYNRLVKKHFNAAGIELPYPHTVVYFGQDRDGGAPPLRVQETGTQAAPRTGFAPPAGHTHRPLAAENRERQGDVLGNELATVVDEEGNVTTSPGTAPARDAAQDPPDRQA